MNIIRNKITAAFYISLLSFFLFTLPLSAQGNFTLSVSPSAVTIPQNGQATLLVTTTISGGFDSSISLSASGQPVGVSVSFNPSTIAPPGSGSSVMTITTPHVAPIGTFPITVTGNGGGVQQTATVSLTITGGAASFAISAIPPALTVAQGQQGTSNIFVIIGGGFKSSVSLSASGVPSGTAVSFSPQTIPSPGDGISTMTITVGSTTPTGTYPITVTGTGGGVQQNTTVTLTVTSSGQNFTISASPSSLTIPQGNQGTSTITTTVSGGFNSSIALSYSGAPSGTTVTFNPQTIPAPGSGNSTMTITVGGSTPSGTYPITVTGNGGGVQKNTTVTLTVTSSGQNFTISASPTSLTIPQGNQGTSTITTTVSGGFNSPINLSTSGVPSGTTVNFSPNPISAPGSGNSGMTITVGSNTPLGTYPITVTGSGGGLQQQTIVTLTVTQGSFTLSASPASLTIAQGNQGTSTITATISGGFNSSIALSYSGAPSGTTLSLNPQTLPAPGSGNSTLTITVGSGTALGTYPITVTGSGGGVQKNTTVTLIVTSPGNFSISASPTSLTIPQGTQNTSTITTSVSGGFNNPINLSTSGVPAGTTVGFSPNPISAPGSGNSTLTITVGSGTALGTYPITVTGSGGGLQQQTTVTLTVTQGSFTLSASPSLLTIAQGNQGTSTITASLIGNFNSSIALSYSGAPSGTTLTLNPQTLPAPGSGNSTLTITVGSNTPVGTYPIVVTGNGGSTQQSTTITLTVTATNGEPFPTPPQVYIDTTWSPPTQGTVWHAHSSSDLTAALAGFSPGDTIILDAGVVYSGNFIIPYKSNPDNLWTYIETSNLSSLPGPGSRVGPGDAQNMPKIVTPNQTPALILCSTVNSYCSASGTNYIRLVGIEVYSNSDAGGGGCKYQLCNNWSWYLIQAMSSDDGTTPPLANNITIDRCYIHGSPTQDVYHGIGAQATYFAVIDSYISDIHKTADDAQAILAYYTPGPLKITDNHISATTEDIMFGGAGACFSPNCNPPTDNPYVPSDIEIRYNNFFKPLSWFSCGDGGTVGPGGRLADGTTCPPSPPAEANQWIVKDNVEFKSGQRAVITGNVLQNNWISAQQGYSLVLTVRSGQSGNEAVVDDILFQSNILTNVTSGINTLEADDGCGPPSYPYCTNPGELKRVYIDNNLMLLDPSLDTTEHIGMVFSAGGVDGANQPFPGLTDVIVQHNTMLMSDNSPPFASWYFVVQANDTCPPAEPSQTHNVWVLDNALNQQVSGDCGLLGTYGLGYYMSDPAPLIPRFYGNVMWAPNNNVAPWPGTSNDATTTPFTYVNPGIGNYQLLIPDWLNTTDGKVSGIDYNQLQQAMQH